MEKEEIWRLIPGFDSLYEMSNFKRIRILFNNILKQGRKIHDFNENDKEHPKIIRPDNQCEHSLPKRKFQKADCKNPCAKPHHPNKSMMLNFYFFHKH
jgi:hypothetical protein